MEQLMTLDPSKRLGSKGAQSVKDHPFFKDINWDTLLIEQPSFVPNPEGMEDTDYFDSRGACMMPTSSSSSSSASSTQSKIKEKQNNDNKQKIKEKNKLEDKIQLDTEAKAKVDRANAIIQEQHPVNVAISSQPSSKKQNVHSSKPSSNQKTKLSSPKRTGSSDEIEDGADFGTFVYKNLPVLERANEDTIRKIRHDTLAAESNSSSNNNNNPSKLLQSYTPTVVSSSSIPGTPNTHAINTSQLSASQSSTLNKNNRYSVDMQQQQEYLDQQLNELASGSGLQTPIKSNYPGFPTNTTNSPSSANSDHKRTRSLSTPDCRVLPTTSTSKESFTNTTVPTGRTPIVSMTPSSSTKTVSGVPASLLVPSTHAPPLPQTVSDSIIRSSPLQLKEEQEEIKGLGFLVADDNPISCKILETILNMLQYQCVIVRNGAQAIRAAMNDVKYDIIFMDIRMPISKYHYIYIK